MQTDSKFPALLEALRFRHGAAPAGQRGSMVIFTESLVTQDLCERLIEPASARCRDHPVSGDNDGSARSSLERWSEEAAAATPAACSSPTSRSDWRWCTSSGRERGPHLTEAGAKGLNLQFCNTVVNYDLPWNPQRIEQRIGRCHRYGQQRDVTVINFLAKDNEAQRLTFEILSQKLELFGTVLDASDQVLHRAATDLRGEVLVSALGAEFEGELRRIYERARTLDEVTMELRALRDKVAEERKRFEEARAHTHDLIEERFEEGVQRVFRQHQERVSRRPRGARSDPVRRCHELPRWCGHRSRAQADREVELLCVAPSPLFPGFREGAITAVGASKEHRRCIWAIRWWLQRWPRPRHAAALVRAGAAF